MPKERWTEIAWQNKVTSVKPSALNKICAHPQIISWILGACFLNVVVLGTISNGIPLVSTISDRQSLEIFALAFIPITLLGFFLGMFTCWPLVRVICSRYNGAPLKAGDQIIILTGPLKGNFTKVYEITSSQGGWNLVRLELGEEHQKKFKDIFEEYSLLKIKNKLQTS